MTTRSDAAVRGALAGVAGGLIMTAMKKKVAPRAMPEEMRTHTFAPKQAVEWVEEQAGYPNALTDDQEMRAAMATHLGYSVITGATYGLIRRKADGVPAPLTGALFGLAVWGASFEGWMPALGIKQRTTERPMEQWPMPIMGHLIFGAATALAYEALQRV
jgi:uncharacterized membrane protein YagU involved in acid resistance